MSSAARPRRSYQVEPFHEPDGRKTWAVKEMLCAVCSKPLGDAALCNLDEKWVHPDCEADAEWESESAARRLP